MLPDVDLQSVSGRKTSNARPSLIATVTAPAAVAVSRRPPASESSSSALSRRRPLSRVGDVSSCNRARVTINGSLACPVHEPAFGHAVAAGLGVAVGRTLGVGVAGNVSDSSLDNALETPAPLKQEMAK